MKKGLFALALGTFTLGIAEFIIEGILTDVAHNMGVSIPQAGHLISIYALGVCAGAFSLIFMLFDIFFHNCCFIWKLLLSLQCGSDILKTTESSVRRCRT